MFVGRFFSLFERERTKEKQKTRRRFIALQLCGTGNLLLSPTCGFVLYARNSWNAGEVSFHRLGTETRNSFCVNGCFIARGVANTITTFSPYWDSKGASPFGRSRTASLCGLGQRPNVQSSSTATPSARRIISVKDVCLSSTVAYSCLVKWSEIVQMASAFLPSLAAFI